LLRSQSKLSDVFIYKNFQTVNHKLNWLLDKVETVVQENTALREVHEDSRKEKAVLQAAVDNLRHKLDKHTAISAPPSPEIMASSTTMEEVTMQLTIIQHNIQDVLAAVRNPPGKRKWHTSNQDAKPTMLTNRRTITATATPPLHSQQRVLKPSIFPSDSDSQHSFTYLCEFPESSMLISLIFVTKSEFSRILVYPTTRNATKTSPTPRPMPQTGWECIQQPCGPSR
jgi:regulator of replication initiation timing